MKLELKKVNEATGTFWYGIWIDDWCTSPSYGTDLEAAKAAFEKIKEAQKNPLPAYEVIKKEEI